MNVELLNTIDEKKLFDAYDFAAICLRLTPDGPIDLSSIEVRAFLEGNKIGSRTFEDDAWLARFIELDLEWTKLTEPAPEPPYDVVAKLKAGEAVFVVVEPHMNFLDCLKDFPDYQPSYEFEIEVVLETADGAKTEWGDWNLLNPWVHS